MRGEEEEIGDFEFDTQKWEIAIYGSLSSRYKQLMRL